MAYTPLRLPSAHAKFGEDVKQQVDPLFADIHAMLRLPLSMDGLKAGCNFTCALALLSVVAGVSSRMLDSDRSPTKNGEVTGRFYECLDKHFPWKAEPTPDGARVVVFKEASKALYKAFRSPLSHTLGRQDDPDTAHLGTIKIAKSPMTEREIIDLETSSKRPPSLPPTLKADDFGSSKGTKLVLDVRPFYWGVRQLVVSTIRARPVDAIIAGEDFTQSTLGATVTFSLPNLDKRSRR